MNKIKSIISYAVFFLGLVFVACQDVDPYGEGIANSLQLSVGQSDVSFDMERSSSVSVNASDNFGWSASKVFRSDFSRSSSAGFIFCPPHTIGSRFRGNSPPWPVFRFAPPASS